MHRDLLCHFTDGFLLKHFRMFTKFKFYPKFVYKYALAKFLLIEFKVEPPVKIFES